jgi:hypothetical protein
MNLLFCCAALSQLLGRPGSEADKCPQCEAGADISAETPLQPGLTHSGHRDAFAERDVMECRPASADDSIRRDVGCPDYRSPLFGIFDNELAKVRNCHRLWYAAYFGKSHHHLGIAEAGINLFV